MVPEAGLEPARSFLRGILSPLCLPIPPLGHKQVFILIDLNENSLIKNKKIADSWVNR